MTLMYIIRIWSLVYSCSTFKAMYISLTLRSTVMEFISSSNTVLRTSCCVMVEAPSRLPPVKLLTNARAMPMKSTPWCM